MHFKHKAKSQVGQAYKSKYYPENKKGNAKKKRKKKMALSIRLHLLKRLKQHNTRPITIHMYFP